MESEFHADGFFVSWECIFYKLYPADNKPNTKRLSEGAPGRELIVFFSGSKGYFFTRFAAGIPISGSAGRTTA